jgi:hypothetical protein
MPKRFTNVLTIADYQRMYQVIAVVLNSDDAKTSEARN